MLRRAAAAVALTAASWSATASAQPGQMAASAPGPGPAGTQPGPQGDDKHLRAVRARTPPVIDGTLDDAAWADAPADDHFTQVRPLPGEAPTERTLVRVLYDDDAVYVAVRMFDREPDRIVARMTRRDRDIESDYVVVTIDGHHDHNTAESFQLNAAGVQVDFFHFDDMQITNEWDAVWDGRARIDREGWTAEYRIPLQALRFSSADVQTWGFQIFRRISRKGEETAWVYWPPELRGLVSRLGHLTGLAGLRPRRTFELRPFLVGRWLGHSDTGLSLLGDLRGESTRRDGDLGVDLKLGLTSNLTLDATVNPDFGQVEADQVVLNLSRFETFYPEKRPFFLEGVDVFQTPVRLFYSRRIGRSPNGLGEGATVYDAQGGALALAETPPPLRILGAAKVSGRVGPRLNLGALAALTGAEDAIGQDATGRHQDLRLSPRRLFGILRGRASLGGASYLGGMATVAERLGGRIYGAAADHDAYVQSLDGQWQSKDAVWRVNGQGVLSERVGGPARRTADGRACPEPSTGDPACRPIARSDGTRFLAGSVGWGGVVSASRVGDRWTESGSALVYSPTLDVNDAGFLTEFNRLQGNLAIGRRENRPSPRLQFWGVNGTLSSGMDFAGVPLFTRPGVNGFLTTRNFWFLSASTGFSLPWQWDTNETTDGARWQRPNGASANLGLETDSRRAVIGNAGFFGYQDFYGGAHLASGHAGLAFQGFPRWELALDGSVSWNPHNHRFYGCTDEAARACDVESQIRSYRFALLDSGSVSVTLRSTYTFTPRLTLQGYAQLYMAQGRWREYRDVTTSGSHPYIRLRDLAPSTFAGDSDGDGKKDDDFQDTALNLNLVLRWEYQPGATLMLVYSRAQAAAFDVTGRTPTFRPGGLTSGPTDDVLLLKLSLLWS